MHVAFLKFQKTYHQVTGELQFFRGLIHRNYQQAIQFTQNQDYKQAYQFFELLSNLPIPENQVGQLAFFKQEAT
mgnify:FL=1